MTAAGSIRHCAKRVTTRRISCTDPADQHRLLRIIVRLLFGGAGVLAWRRMAASMAKANMTSETCRCQPCHERVSLWSRPSSNQQIIIRQTTALKLSTVYQWPEIAEVGGLAAYGPNYNQLCRQHARQLAKLLQGTKPADNIPSDGLTGSAPIQGRKVSSSVSSNRGSAWSSL